MAASIVGFQSGGLPSAQAADRDPVMLRPTAQRDLFRVRAELEVEGNVNVPKNPLVSRKSDLMLPITSNAVLDYEERIARVSTANPAARVAQRYYHEATSRSELNRRTQTSELRDSVRSTIVRHDVSPEVIYSADDYFRSDELELVRLPASSLGMDDLLPTTPVRVGATYSPSKESLVSLLCLSSVEASDVTAEVMEITATSAKIQFKGKVDGSIDGVPTVIRTVGKLTFDRTVGACTWLAMALHETREIGKAKPGFDVSATIKMLRKPLESPIALPASSGRFDAARFDAVGPIPQDRLYVDFESKELGFAVLMDRRWGLMSDVPGAAMMRMIDSDRSIAQCDFRPLASLPSGSQWTLDAFEQDVKKTLGEQLGNLVSADQRASETGLRVLSVTAAGQVEGIPIQWVLMHFSDDAGRRMLATFTMEAKNAATFAGSDMQLASSLRLVERKRPAQGEAISRSDQTGRSTRIAKSKTSDSAASEVQSASDLR